MGAKQLKAEAEEIVARMDEISMKALLRVHTEPGVWPGLPPYLRKKFRREKLVYQNRDDAWVLSDVGLKVRDILTKNTEEPIITYGPKFKKENTND